MRGGVSLWFAWCLLFAQQAFAEPVTVICKQRQRVEQGYYGYKESDLGAADADAVQRSQRRLWWYHIDPQVFDQMLATCAASADQEGGYLLFAKGALGLLPLYKREQLRSRDIVEDPSPVNPRTFTFFFMGTCSHTGDINRKEKYWQGETVSTLYHHALEAGGTPAETVLAVNGPGSGNLDTHRLFVHFDTEYPRLLGMVWGHGVRESIRHALAVVRLENENPQREAEVNRIRQKVVRGQLGPIARINMLAFSRGAIAAMQLSHLLAGDKQLGGAEVNLFLIDPVPGFIGEYFWQDLSRLPTNVAHATIIYAQDDYSHGFAPVLPSPTQATTKLVLHSFPGYHPTLVGNHNGLTSDDTQRYDLSGSGLVVRDMAEKFLMTHGTPLTGNLNYNDADYLRLYEQILANRAGYERLRRHSYFGINMRWWWWYSRKLLVGRFFGSTYMHKVAGLQALAGYANHHHRELATRQLAQPRVISVSS